MTVSIGLIGAGVMGADHARTLTSQVGGATLRALTDADAKRARAVADETGVETIAADSLALINDPSVDAVIIASPDQTHHDLTLACIAVGKPVLCEKPLAPTSLECLDIVRAEVSARRRLVQVGYMRRFDPGYGEMRAKYNSGDLGHAVFFHCVHRNLSAPPWFDSKMAINNSAVHEIDIARWLLGEELKTIQVFRPETSVPNATVRPLLLVFGTENGKIVTVENNNSGGYGYDVRGELACEKGTIALRSPSNTEINANLLNGTVYAPDWRQRFAAAYRLQLQAWVRSISTGKADGASAWDGYVASSVAETALLALDRGQSVTIELAAQPSLYA